MAELESISDNALLGNLISWNLASHAMGDEEAGREMGEIRDEDGDGIGICEPFADFTEKRLKQNTKKAYASSWRMVVEYFKHKHPDLYDEQNDNVIASSPSSEQYKMLFDTFSRKRKRGGKFFMLWNEETGEYGTYARMNGLLNGIKHAFKVQNVEIPREHKLLFEESLGGYKRFVAELKMQGKMKLTEGKLSIRFKAYRMP